MSFARGHGGDLTGYIPEGTAHYALRERFGRPRTRYPIGVSLLAMPAVVVTAWLHPPFEEDLRTGHTPRIEMLFAGIIAAGAGAFFFRLIASEFQSAWIGLAATFILAFSTSMWSTASRLLWQHGPLVLMIVIAMRLLQRAARQPSVVQYVSLPLAIAYVIRPTAIVPVGVITAYVLVFHRAWLARYLGWAALIAVPWITFNCVALGTPLEDYYVSNAFSQRTVFVEGLLGVLFSPSRGLFVFSPVLLLAASGFMFAIRDAGNRPLYLAYGAIVLGITLIAGAANMWWGGHAYGPRLMTDVLPLLVFFVAFNLRPPLAVPLRGRVSLVAAVAVLAIVGTVIHARGVFRQETWLWNAVPENVDENPARLWDWSDPQFAR
jgi:hypothetical protein